MARMSSLTFALCVLVCVLPLGQTRFIHPFQFISGLSVQQKTNMCEECTKIIELFSDMISHEDTQDLIKGTLRELCLRLPGGEAESQCIDEIDKYLPLVVKHFTDFTRHREGDICVVIGLCSVHSKSRETIQLAETGVIRAETIRGTSLQAQITPQCTFCLFIIKELESLLPKERTEETVVRLLEKICSLLPKHFLDQCNNFMEKYGKQIVDFLLSSATPHTICAVLHLCLVEETPITEIRQPSACDSCKILAVLTQFHLGQNATELQNSSFLKKLCTLHPNAIPECEVFTRYYGPRLLGILGKQKDAINACEEDLLCQVYN
ncbi:surfactant protein Bb [Chanos chanos]|uniref:Pulmonary surfactant-associated protein B n=1 Tax=Chanos chanos TaxID=29144 RepID=A0A6J2WCD2_CHACN|nr:pulmonary surfactant-associated protein B [Chanos chanos]